MTQNLPNWFTKKYDDTVKHRAQQRDRRLAGTVAGGGTFIGDTVYFPRLGVVEMYASARMARMALANSAMDMISVTAAPRLVAFGIWDPDKTKLSISAATEYGIASANAGMRAEDMLIINALNDAAVNGVTPVADAQGVTPATETITTIGDYNTLADLDTFAQAVETLGTNEMFEAEDIGCVTPFKIAVNNSLDPYLVFGKNDDKNLPWEKVNWRTSQQLYDQAATKLVPSTSTGIDMYMYARSAIRSDYNNEMTEINERDGPALTDIIGRWFQAGAKVIEPKGIVRIKSKYNFTISRKALVVSQ